MSTPAPSPAEELLATLAVIQAAIARLEERSAAERLELITLDQLAGALGLKTKTLRNRLYTTAGRRTLPPLRDVAGVWACTRAEFGSWLDSLPPTYDSAAVRAALARSRR
ncbi:MAG TPA: hypothetical protein VF017_15415 [Thermoanaerobaculia bacterium]|nr:hypothetical protein [Thermoanaerobaculia bacterium]